MTSPNAVIKRLVQYLLPVIIFSIAFNITKFMEAEICWELDVNSTYAIKLLEHSPKEPRWKVTDVQNAVSNNISETYNDTTNNTEEEATYFSACPSKLSSHDVNRLLHFDKIKEIELWYPRVSSITYLFLYIIFCEVKLLYLNIAFFSYIIIPPCQNT